MKDLAKFFRLQDSFSNCSIERITLKGKKNSKSSSIIRISFKALVQIFWKTVLQIWILGLSSGCFTQTIFKRISEITEVLMRESFKNIFYKGYISKGLLRIDKLQRIQTENFEKLPITGKKITIQDFLYTEGPEDIPTDIFKNF